jgi:hypothetical protein
MVFRHRPLQVLGGNKEREMRTVWMLWARVKC